LGVSNWLASRKRMPQVPGQTVLSVVAPGQTEPAVVVPGQTVLSVVAPGPIEQEREVRGSIAAQPGPIAARFGPTVFSGGCKPLLDPIVYNIPVSMVEMYPGRNLIVRSHDPSEIVGGLSRENLARASYVQVLSVSSDLESLINWGKGIPVDLVVKDPDIDLPLLYQCSPLLARHPVRVTVPVVPGFSKLVKLAVSLNFAVKLDVSQADSPLVEEMSRVAHSYLHQATVAQPIEYFHSLFMAFYRGEPVTLWAIQEEDPSYARYITDDGKETLSKRLAGLDLKGEVSSFVSRFKDDLISEGGECRSCEFLGPCSGYFKWPDPEYRCDGVKALFRTLKDTAEELRRDLAEFDPIGKEEWS